jgi:hypothetical protein
LKIASVAINTSTSGDNVIVAAVPKKIIRAIFFSLNAAAAVNVGWRDGAAGTFISGPTPMSGNNNFVVDWALPMPTGYTIGHFETTAGNALVLNLSGAVLVGGHLIYALADT